MKKRLIILLTFLFIGISYAQASKDSFFVAHSMEEGADTVNIRQLVEMQILAARLKALEEKSNVESEIISVQEVKTNETTEREFEKEDSASASISFWGGIMIILYGIPIEYKILIIFSIALFVLILFKRTTLNVKKKIKTELKKKIGMLREEKVFVKPDSKKSDLRKTLVESTTLIQLSEKNIGKTAKELKLSKGELLLAARIKYLEYGKM